MNALNLTTTQTNLPEEAKTYMTILSELLRDVDLEARMLTLIKTEEFINEEEMNQIQLQSIQVDLELEIGKLRKMLFMVEQAKVVLEA